MTDDIKQDVQPTDTTRDGLDKTVKTYTEEEVQKLIKERIAREKDASKKLLEDATNEKTSLEASLSKYEGILQKTIDAKAGSIPEQYKKLFDKLTLAEKLDFLADLPDDKPETTPFPKTPQSNGGDNPQTKNSQKFRI